MITITKDELETIIAIMESYKGILETEYNEFMEERDTELLDKLNSISDETN